MFILLFLFVMNSNLNVAQGNSSGGDDSPSACVEGAVIDGKTMENILEKDTEWCKANHCKDTLISLSKHSKRRRLAITPQAIKGKVMEGKSPIQWRRMIDGPANLRDQPNGKVIGSFEDKFTVLIEGQKGEWYFIRGYWSKECETGWTHQKNLVPYDGKKAIQ